MPVFLLILAGGPARAETRSPVELQQEALEAYFDERYADAVDLFQRVLAQDPRNPAAQKGLDNARRRLKAALDKKREQERRNIFAVEDYMKAGNLLAAYERLRDVIARVPDHPDAQALKAKLRARAEKAAAKAKTDSAAHHDALGLLSYMDGDWFRAAEHWQGILDFNPDRLDLVGKIEKARQNLAEEQRLERIRVLTDLGTSGQKEGRFEDAKKAWEDLLTLDPANPAAREGVEKAVRAAAEQAQAKRLEEIQALQVQAIDAYSNRRLAESTRLWNRVIQMDPANVLARDYLDRIRSGTAGDPLPAGLGAAPVSDGARARALVDEGRYVEAVEALSRRLARNPDDGETADLLKEVRARQKEKVDTLYKDGLAAYVQGQKNLAIIKWQEVLKVDPDFIRAKQALVKTMQEVREP